MKKQRKKVGPSSDKGNAAAASAEQCRIPKFEIYGEEMIEKNVRNSGNSGRVYLPSEWVGKNVKIIRLD
ncbi:MAG: DUF2080 family transposase-associated protein [Desulfarculaceae bacterium]|jgi:putative transposon-encoded protein